MSRNYYRWLRVCFHENTKGSCLLGVLTTVGLSLLFAGFSVADLYYYGDRCSVGWSNVCEMAIWSIGGGIVMALMAFVIALIIEIMFIVDMWLCDRRDARRQQQREAKYAAVQAAALTKRAL